MKKLLLFALGFSFLSVVFGQNVKLTATAATLGPTNYNSISDAFAAINAGTHKGVITIEITGDVTEPDAPVTLFASTGSSSYTSVLIKPTGGNWKVSKGNQIANRGVVELRAADNVTIDGDPGNTGTRQLTFECPNTLDDVSTTVIWIATDQYLTNKGTSNITVKNCNVVGGRFPAPVSVFRGQGITISNYRTQNVADPTIGASGGWQVESVTIENNVITRCGVGINAFCAPAGSTPPLSFTNNLKILRNKIGSDIDGQNVLANGISLTNVGVGYTIPALVEGNDVRAGVVSPTGTGVAAAVRAITFAQGCSGTQIIGNYVHDIYNPNVTNGCFAIGSTLSAADVRIENNIIRDVVGARAFNALNSANTGYGIFLSGAQTNLKINHNTIALLQQNPSVDGSLADYMSAFVNISSPTSVLSEFQNNILVNNNPSTNAYAFRCSTNTNIASAAMNHNNYLAPNGNIGNTGGTQYANLAAWQAGSTKDATSLSVTPAFVSVTDLHLAAGSPMIGAGTTLAAITKDIDGDTRKSPPDIGADEYTVSVVNNVITNSGSGLAAGYPTLKEAIDALNAATITSPVVMTLKAAEKAPAGGYVITATGTAANTLTIQGDGNTITANEAHTAGSINDGIFKILGSDYLTISNFILQENTANTVLDIATNTMTEWGVALLNAAPDNGTQNVTLTNLTISLNKDYANAFGMYGNSNHSAADVLTLAEGTGANGQHNHVTIGDNNISMVNIGIALVGSAATVADSATVENNTISEFGKTGTLSAYSRLNQSVNGILISNFSNVLVKANNITSTDGGTTAGTLRGVLVSAEGSPVYPDVAHTVAVESNTISLKTGVVAGLTEGISNNFGSPLTSLKVLKNNFTGFTNKGASPTGAVNFIMNTAGALNQQIDDNNYINLSLNTTGAVVLINNTVSTPAGGTQYIRNNIIEGTFTRTGVIASGNAATTCIVSGLAAASVGNAILEWSGNNFSNITLAGGNTFIGIENRDGNGTVALPSTGVNKVIKNNIFNNISGLTGGSVTGIFLTRGSSPSLPGNIIENNTISNISGAGALSGITVTLSTAQYTTIKNNKVFNFLGSAGNISAITDQASVSEVIGNEIHDIQAAGTANGIVLGGTTMYVSKNKVYNLSNILAGSTNANGISTSMGTGAVATIFNNFIGNIHTPNSTNVIAINGINLTGTASYNIYFNTIFLNASSTGATFGTSGVQFASTVTALDLRNNIIVNQSVAGSEEANLNTNGIIAAIRRSMGSVGLVPANYALTSNNNLFWVAPGAAKNNRMTYAEGSSSAGGTIFGNMLKSTDDVKSFFVNRDQQSFEEMPPFISTDPANVGYLRLNPATQTFAESGGQPVTGITDDYDGEIRNALTPDMGADEFSGTLPVNLVSFAGHRDAPDNILSWKTASEHNNKGFEVLRSEDGINFRSIGFVRTEANNGNSTQSLNYQYRDIKTPDITFFYQLKQMDMDGRSKLSPVVKITGAAITRLKLDGVFPNPATTQINVRILSPQGEKLNITLIDANGRAVGTLVNQLEKGSNTIGLDVRKLSQGMYFIKMETAKGDRIVERFIRQ